MKLIAAPGLQVPMADNPHRYITDSEPVEVLEDTYYYRRIADGDLIVVPEGDLKVVTDGDQSLVMADSDKNTAKRAKE